jgi:hypothetical protein
MRYGLLILIMVVAGSSMVKRVKNTNHPPGIPHTYRILETVTDSTRPIEQMTQVERMNAHIVHFTGAVMSDTFVVSHFSRAFVPDQYSNLLRPGKYMNGSAVLSAAINSSLDGIAIPRKTRLVVYSQPNLAGPVLLDVTGPAIVNNGIWESSEFYAVANTKNFSPDLQEIFPQNVRSYGSSGTNNMSYWQQFSFEIMATTK